VGRPQWNVPQNQREGAPSERRAAVSVNGWWPPMWQPAGLELFERITLVIKLRHSFDVRLTSTESVAPACRTQRVDAILFLTTKGKRFLLRFEPHGGQADRT